MNFEGHTAVHDELVGVVEDVTASAALASYSANIPLGQYDAESGGGVVCTFFAIYWE